MPVWPSAAITFPAGQPIPASGTNQYGIIGSRTGNVSGTAEVFGNGPYDLFVGLRTVYPFERFEAHHVPVYGNRVAIDCPSSQGYVFPHEGGIYALTDPGGKVALLKFEKERMRFEPFAAAFLPGKGGDLTGFIGSDQ